MTKPVEKSAATSKMTSVLNRLKLQGKFFIYFTGLVLLVVLFVAAAVFYFHRQLLLQQAQEKAISLTRTLAYTSLNAVLQDDYLTYSTSLEDITG